ncbi:MAG: hypothetical protein LBQ66_04025, partial [Planctomycetaceae bacterium]|nr:hypothetical protein [Planctomycetaceae bacterium]
MVNWCVLAIQLSACADVIHQESPAVGCPHYGDNTFWQMFCNQKSDNHNNKYFFVVILLFDSFDYMNVISTGHF